MFENYVGISHHVKHDLPIWYKSVTHRLRTLLVSEKVNSSLIKQSNFFNVCRDRLFLYMKGGWGIGHFELSNILLKIEP